MAVQGIPVVIVESGGFPVRPVEANYPLMTVSENSLATQITISDLGSPFIIQGYEPPIEGLALSGDNGAPLRPSPFLLLFTRWFDASAFV